MKDRQPLQRLPNKGEKSEEIKDSFYDFNWFDWFIYRGRNDKCRCRKIDRVFYDPNQ